MLTWEFQSMLSFYADILCAWIYMPSCRCPQYFLSLPSFFVQLPFSVHILRGNEPWSETCVMMSKRKDLKSNMCNFFKYIFISIDILNLLKSSHLKIFNFLWGTTNGRDWQQLFPGLKVKGQCLLRTYTFSFIAFSQNIILCN